MKLIMLFACEASSDGKDFGWEMNQRYQEIVKILKNDPDVTLLFAYSVVGFNPPELCGEIMEKKLLNDGFSHGKFRPLYKHVVSTICEIDAVEDFISKHIRCNDIWAASSDYHIPRIIKMWKKRHGRTVKPFPLAIPHVWYIRKRALLEYPKTLLMYFPAPAQKIFSHIMRRLRMI